MYLKNNKAEYIKRLQAMLGIPQSGRIDGKMRNTVKTVQENAGIPQTGTVDYVTFLAIKNRRHQRELESELPVPIMPYEASDSITEINALLSTMINLYKPELRRPHGRVYGFDSIKAVRALREIYCLERSDEVDYMLMHRIKADLSSIRAICPRLKIE